MVGKGEFRERFNIFSSILSFSARLENSRGEMEYFFAEKIEKKKKDRRRKEEIEFFKIEKKENLDKDYFFFYSQFLSQTKESKRKTTIFAADMRKMRGNWILWNEERRQL